MLNFEESLKELELIVNKMEDKNTTLDESLELFGKGAKLSGKCMDILKETKGKIELITKEIDGISKTDFEDLE